MATKKDPEVESKVDVPLKLYRKMFKIMASNINIKKSGWNKHHGYAFATDKDVTEAIREEFIKHKILCIVTELDVHCPKENLTRATYQFTLIDTESGEMAFFNISGDGSDNRDKGIYKAFTGAVKYFLMKEFMIATEDDPERDSEKKLDYEEKNNYNENQSGGPNEEIQETRGFNRSSRFQKRS